MDAFDYVSIENARAKISSSNHKLDNSEMKKTKPKYGSTNNGRNLNGMFNHQDKALREMGPKPTDGGQQLWL